MALKERKTNPDIRTMFIRTLTEPEMKKATGGSYNWKLLALCYKLGIHDFVFTGKYQYEDHPLAGFIRHDVYICSRCGKTELRRRVWLIGYEKENAF